LVEVVQHAYLEEVVQKGRSAALGGTVADELGNPA